MVEPRSRCAIATVGCLALVLVLGPSGALARTSRPVRCPGGVFTVESGAPLVVAEAAAPATDAIALIDATDSEKPGIAIASGCAKTKVKVKTTRGGTRVKASWKPGACMGESRRVRLKARTNATCDRIEGTLRAGKRRQRFSARRFDGTVTPTLEDGAGSSAVVDEAGGMLETRGADGTVYRLSVPAGALVVPETLTLTPLASLTGTPLTGGLLAGVELGPSGLQLYAPATLTMELPAPPDGTLAVAAFGYSGRGEGFHLRPATRTGPTLTMLVGHFSGFGAGTTAPPSMSVLGQLPVSASEEHYSNRLAALLGSGTSAEFVEVLVEWFDSAVLPRLQMAAASDTALVDALREYRSWENDSITLSLVADPDVAARDSTVGSHVYPALEAAVDRALQRCASLQSFAGAEDALRWQAIAGLGAFGAPPPSLALDAVLGRFCLEVVYVDTSFPATLLAGRSEPLDVTVGAAFNGGDPTFQEPLAVTVAASGAQPASASGTTDAQGRYHATFAPVGGTDVSLVLDTCIAAPMFPKLRQVCQRAIIARGLDVVPASVALAPGGIQQFTALLVGQPTTDVAWTATGGTVDSNGRYTAGSTNGMYAVRATSRTNTSLSASATVVVTSGGGPTGMVVWHDGSARTNCGASGGSNVDPGAVFNDGDGNTGPIPFMDSVNASGAAGGASGSAQASNATTFVLDSSTGDKIGIDATCSVSRSAEVSGDATVGSDAIADGGIRFDVVGGPAEYMATGSLVENAGPGESVATVHLEKVFSGAVFDSRGASFSRSGVLGPGTYDLSFRASVAGGPSGSEDASLTLHFELHGAGISANPTSR